MPPEQPTGVDVPLADEDFDRLLPKIWRTKSQIHFTPVEVAWRAAELLVARPDARVLDVGAAVGKFCLVAGRLYPEALFVGIERRRHLVRIATGLSRRLGLTNVLFAYGDMVEIDWSMFDGFYLYNPFAEHLPGRAMTLDDTLELHPGYFLFYVQYVRERLAEARVGTRVVAYNGFGGEPPPEYELVVDEVAGADRLELWVKTRPSKRRRRPQRARAGRGAFS
jgi:hypothetical protein